MSKNIGKFCSVAKPGTMIYPKKIDGYQEPAPQVLSLDKQQIKFIYTPIKYKINYDISDGEFKYETPKDSYTIEDEDYIPPYPSRKGYDFIGWEPENIPHGSFGDINFIAKWKEHAILLPGLQLNEAIDKLIGKENVVSIQISNTAPNDSINYINISSSKTPIYAFFSDGVLFLYCNSNIHCNKDMSHAFENFVLLKDIKCFSQFICEENSDISFLFNNCKLLSNVSSISKWGSGKFSDFTGALNGTSALELRKVPIWYRWNVAINYISSSGIIVDKKNISVIPGEIIYPKSFNGYVCITKNITIDSKDIEYTFIYNPIKYNIYYDLHGGKLYNPKNSYTIEDEDYYPAEPISEKRFKNWSPECINHGEYGSMTFVAKYYTK